MTHIPLTSVGKTKNLRKCRILQFFVILFALYLKLCHVYITHTLPFRGYPPTMVRSNMVDSKVQQDMKLTHDNILQSLATSLSSTLSQANSPDFNLAAVATSLANFQVNFSCLWYSYLVLRLVIVYGILGNSTKFQPTRSLTWFSLDLTVLLNLVLNLDGTGSVVFIFSCVERFTDFEFCISCACL